MVLRTFSIIALGFITSFKARADELAELEPTAPGEVVARLSGDVAVEELPQEDGSVFYRAGVHRVTTPLPEGYPRPTPPGVVEIKEYPEVRRATFEGEGSGPDGMKNSAGAFWPLFAHIKSRGIAMTAPVEIEYEGLQPGKTDSIEGWSMSFLYRSQDNGPTEAYANIAVQDAEPVTVVATGLAGDATRERIDEVLKRLHTSLAGSESWQARGDVRILGYNGPDVPPAERWSEVQLTVAEAEPAAE